MQRLKRALDFILFADDTKILYSHKDANYLSYLHFELLKLSQWYRVLVQTPYCHFPEKGRQLFQRFLLIPTQSDTL